MTLQNKSMYIAVIVAVTIVTGFSGITQAEAISNSTATKTYISCDTDNPRISFDTVKATWGVWEQDDDEKQYFKLGYDFPQTIYEFVSGGIFGQDSCEPVSELVEIKITVVGEKNNEGNRTKKACLERGYGGNNPVTVDYPLDWNKDAPNGFPSTNGIVDVKCNDHTFKLFDVNTKHHLSIEAKYTILGSVNLKSIDLEDTVKIKKQ